MDQSTPPKCPHSPPCPPPEDHCRGTARIVAAHPEQGWNLLCNGVLEFEDTGQLLPDGSMVAPHRPTGGARAAA
ncbi:DUF5999 family protein [Streptomyces sp. NBC_01233]|uniref:DUF5999 family protein n=1 Tax=Streptomyces sp. NBC_01233 TaxID=2903787 RepID=UPI002E0EA860